jgi:tRNA (cmo5U34)-methyltransferase
MMTQPQPVTLTVPIEPETQNVNTSSLGHLPASEHWQFDESVMQVFDDMLHRSIPQYVEMRNLVTEMASEYVIKRTDVVDLGCSNGLALMPLVHQFGALNRYLGLEISPPMLEAARARFKGYIEAGVVEIRECDLREGLPYCEASVILSVLTLQFVPIEHRQRLLDQCYASLRPRGAFILVEKVLGASAALDETMVRQYYAFKRESGYSDEEIRRKRLALEGVLVPMTARWNEDLLRQTGFREVDCFWRWQNFGAWIAVKG